MPDHNLALRWCRVTLRDGIIWVEGKDKDDLVTVEVSHCDLNTGGKQFMFVGTREECERASAVIRVVSEGDTDA